MTGLLRALRFDGFGRSLLFALMAGLAAPACVLLLRPVIGIADALSFVMVASVAGYLAGLGPSPRARLGAVLLTLLLGGGAWLLGASSREMFFVSAALLSVGRSVICLPAGGARAWAIEAALAGGGALLAGTALRTAPYSLAFAVWTFFLIQSLFFLVARDTSRAAAPEADPFDAAHARAVEVMESL